MSVTIQLIDRGTVPDDGTGDDGYDGAGKINTSLTNLKAAIDLLHTPVKQNTATTLVLGTAYIADNMAGTIHHDLPNIGAVTDAPITFFNADTNENDIEIDPDGTDEIFVNNSGQGAGSVFTLSAGFAITFYQRTTSSWDAVYWPINLPDPLGSLAFLNYPLLENSSGVLDSDHSYIGATEVWTLGGTVNLYAPVYMASDGDVEHADADTTSTMPCIGICIEAGVATDEREILYDGIIRDDSWNWTVGDPIFVSTTAGGLTQTAPSGSGDQVQQVGWAISADRMRVRIDDTVVERA